MSSNQKLTQEEVLLRIHRNNPYITINSIYSGLSKNVECECLKCGFGKNGEWNARPATLFKAKACPVCSGKQLNALFYGWNDLETWCINNEREDLLEEWDYEENTNDSGTPNIPGEITRANCKIGVHWKCSICGNKWVATCGGRTQIDKRTGHPSGCPKCSKAGTSFSEMAILYYLERNGVEFLHRNTSVIGKELDIYIPAFKTAIEFDGYLYHKDKLVSDNEKDDLCKLQGINLIRIRDELLPDTSSATIISTKSIQARHSFETAINALFNLLNVNTEYCIDLRRDYASIISCFKHIQKSNSLALTHPLIAEEWHPSKNGTLTPDNFSAGEAYPAWWRCLKCKNEWQTPIYARVKAVVGCPVCALKYQGTSYSKKRASLLSLKKWCEDNGKEDLLLDWDYEENNEDSNCPNTPEECSYSSPRGVHWKCQICGWKWMATPYDRRIGKKKCLKCLGRVLELGVNDLKSWCLANDSDIYKDWDYVNNKIDDRVPDTPELLRFDCNISAHWKCYTCGYTWEVSVHKRTINGRGCKKCALKNHQKKVINLDTNEVYESIISATKALGYKSSGSLIACLKKEREMAYGYHWDYYKK